jgi:hypothetical protein
MSEPEWLRMTEAQWLTYNHPMRMFDFWGDRGTFRKRRLFQVACCRLVWPLFEDECSRKAVEVAEGHADGLFSDEDLETVHKAHRTRFGLVAQPRGSRVVVISINTLVDTAANQPSADRLLSLAVHCASLPTTAGPYPGDHLAPGHYNWLSEVAKRVRDAYYQCTGQLRDGLRRSQCNFLRDIFGNPFRPVAINDTWLTANVVGIAQAIYDDRAFERLPILADALEDAGCTSADILDHCRQPGEHVRGCWVIVAVWGKA